VSGRNRPSRITQAIRAHDEAAIADPFKENLTRQETFNQLLLSLRVHAGDMTDAQRVGIANDVAMKGGQLRSYELRAEAATCAWEWMLEHRFHQDQPKQRGDKIVSQLGAAFGEHGTVAMRHVAIDLADFILDVYDALGGANAINDLGLIPYDWDFVPAVLLLLDWGVTPPHRPKVEEAVRLLRAGKKPLTGGG